MKVALGAVVTDVDARIALLDAAPPYTTIDQSRIDLAGDGLGGLVSTLVSTGRMLAEGGHDLVATRVCSDDADTGRQLVTALSAADLINVTAVSQPDATTAMAQVLTGGQITTTLRSPEEPEFALARGAAMAGLTGATAVAPASVGTAAISGAVHPFDAGGAVLDSNGGPQLAYSEVAEGDDLWSPGYDLPEALSEPMPAIDPDEMAGVDEDAGSRQKMLLLGSTVGAVVVVGFAALAVSVAIGIRPTVSQQALRMQDPAVPGQYFPVTPGQGVKPDGQSWTEIEQLPPPGVVPEARSFEPRVLGQPAGAGGSIIDLYPDGTVGVRDVGAVAGAVPAGGGQPVPDVVARLIPDFSRFTPNDVINLVAGTTMATAGAASTVLNSLGMVVAVTSQQGQLFATTPAAAGTTGATDSGTPRVIPEGIPQVLFQPGATPEQKSAVLPEGSREITQLPVSDKPGTSVLGTPITDVDELGTTGVVGNAPPVPVRTESQPGVSDTQPGVNGDTPAVTPDAPMAPSDVNVPESPPAVPGDGDVPQGKPVPVEQVPASEPPPVDKPSVVPSVPVSPPVQQAPVDTSPPAEKPSVVPSVPVSPPVQQAPVDTSPPAEKPSVVPSVPVSPPVQQAPVVSVPVSPPVQQAPVQQAPVQQAPVQQAPVQQAPVVPSVPSVPIPKLPSLPSGGGSFGGGSTGGGSFGGGSTGGGSTGGGSTGGGSFGGGSFGGGSFGGGSGN